MIVRDLSYWGHFKIIFIINWVMPLLLLPLIIVVFLVDPEKVTFNNSFKTYGMTIEAGGEGLVPSFTAFPFILLISFIGLWIQAAVLYALARYTPLGRIKIGARGAP